MIQYEFQVVEYKDPDTKKIWKVELQMKKTYRDEWMNVLRHESFMPVPRVEMLMRDHNG